MASINFNVGRTKFTFDGSSIIPIEPYDQYIKCVRRVNIDGEFSGIPAGVIWSSYFPGLASLNSFNAFNPGREYEIDVLIPFTLEY